MSDAEKLEALVRRATDSGWKSPWEEYHYPLVYTESGVWPHSDSEYFTSIKDIIFNHDFARALFGDDPIYVVQARKFYRGTRINDRQSESNEDKDFSYSVSMTEDLWHVQQAAISEDRIGYMYKAVFGEL